MTTPRAADGCWNFAIDRGGTFTDVIAVAPDGAVQSLKLPSTSAAYADAAVEAMRRLLGLGPGDAFPAHLVGAIRVGTTVATNALLERTGAKTLFVATAGFGDALLLGDQTRPDLFALNIVRPPPLYACLLYTSSRAVKSCCFHCETRMMTGKSGPTAARTALTISAANRARPRTSAPPKSSERRLVPSQKNWSMR